MKYRSLNYSVSAAAKQGLIHTFCRTQVTTYTDADGLQRTETKPVLSSRQTKWLRAPSREYSQFAPSPIYNAGPTQSGSYYEGLSHSIIQVARNYDYSDWLPQPGPPDYQGNPLYYNPADYNYIEENLPDYQQDLVSYPPSLRSDLLKELSQSHRHHSLGLPDKRPQRLSLALPEDTRKYLAGLLQYHNIPPCPVRRQSTNLTAQVSWLLEVVGTGHLIPSPEIAVRSGIGLNEGISIVTLQQLVSEPNPRKAQAVRQRADQPNRLNHKHGNHSGTPLLNYYDLRTMRKPPSMTKLDTWTQEDVDWATTHGLADIAAEAAALLGLRPPPQASLPAPSLGLENVGLAHEIEQRRLASTAGQPADLYHYKDRNITEPILLAYQYHYLTDPPMPWPKIALLDDIKPWRLPMYVLRGLAVKEHVRRQLEANPSSNTNRLSRKTQPRKKLMEALINAPS